MPQMSLALQQQPHLRNEPILNQTTREKRGVGEKKMMMRNDNAYHTHTHTRSPDRLNKHMDDVAKIYKSVNLFEKTN